MKTDEASSDGRSRATHERYTVPSEWPTKVADAMPCAAIARSIARTVDCWCGAWRSPERRWATKESSMTRMGPWLCSRSDSTNPRYGSGPSPTPCTKTSGVLLLLALLLLPAPLLPPAAAAAVAVPPAPSTSATALGAEPGWDQ